MKSPPNSIGMRSKDIPEAPDFGANTRKGTSPWWDLFLRMSSRFVSSERATRCTPVGAADRNLPFIVTDWIFRFGIANSRPHKILRNVGKLVNVGDRILDIMY